MSERVEGSRALYIAGSTGSIGTQALDVVRASEGNFEVVALGAGTSVGALAAQAREWHPRRVAIGDGSRAAQLRALVPPGTEVLAGEGALAELVRDADIVLNAVVGFAGLPVTLAALEGGRRLALANKESLIAGGPIVQRARRAERAELVPVDSEHCAIHQCLAGAGLAGARPPEEYLDGGTGVAANGGTGLRGAARSLRRLVVTASGGPFRGRSRGELEGVTVEDALAHPTWKMGPKITVDSSTLMNKGLEVIEAHLLFGVPYDQIDVVVHPQSVVHSMAEMSDGATIAQLSMPDMRLPIGYALSYPERMEVPFGAIDWSALGHLDFEVPDHEAFPCLGLAYEAGRRGGTAPACLNGANEVAVEGFLRRRLRWVDIPAVVEHVMDRHVASEPRDLADVLAADAEGRARAVERVDELTGMGRAGGGPGGVRQAQGREAGVGKSGVTAGRLERDGA
jgi:1-deoxy-D-xylulose-5-phosphate reductoisomerase